MIGFLLALLLWSIGAGPAPAPHGVGAAPVAPAPAQGGSRGSLTGARTHTGTSVAPIAPPAPATTVAAPAEPSCAAGEEQQGELGCVAVQLPEETVGRAYG